MHHCLQIQELLYIIFRKYTQYDSGLLARLARTCIAFQDPALNILWHTQKTLLPLLKCLPPDAWAIKEYKFGIIRNLTSSDFERIYFYCHRIRILGRFASRPLSQYFEAQVLPIIWSRKPSLGPLLSNVSEVNLVDGSFHGLAIYPLLVIGPNVTGIEFEEAAPLELLSTLCGVMRLSFSNRVSLTSCAISIISTLPMLKHLRLSVTEQEVKNCVPHIGNNFPAITHLAISSKTMNACQLMLLQLQSGMLRSLTLTRTASDARWSIRRLLITLHECNLALRLESLHIGDCPMICSSLGFYRPASKKIFNMDAHTFEYLSSFKQLRDLYLDSSSVHLNDSDVTKLAKSLPQLRSLEFSQDDDLDKVPKCTFTGMQHLIQFCPKLETLTLSVDARQIPILDTQPDREYPLGLQLTTLNLCNSLISNADEVVSYLTMLFPVLGYFSTAYYYIEDEDEENYNRNRAIWLEVEDRLLHFN
ncbi:hypothetical protein K443DRAFT_131056 [Laccaria amethystina LaAM-08-1]|uniref:Unplaced genomic scaffold K443scaffold_39, whole genome shotgun sequence n=1 Tax=Laccaria amethystina LaAM-08-1 TaxID=1095629 RepID=A0A0C9XQN3_9AGAR|nr:hypothetical protein K443DRAFT_131056 [Laccaria amethystina LaAM-08-1]